MKRSHQVAVEVVLLALMLASLFAYARSQFDLGYTATMWPLLYRFVAVASWGGLLVLWSRRRSAPARRRGASRA